MTACDLCLLAGELAMEHGTDALSFARRAHLTFEAEGENDRAHIWYALSVLLDDIAAKRLDPTRPVTIH